MISFSTFSPGWARLRGPTQRSSRRGTRRVHAFRSGKRPTTEASSSVTGLRTVVASSRCPPPAPTIYRLLQPQVDRALRQGSDGERARGVLATLDTTVGSQA